MPKDELSSDELRTVLKGGSQPGKMMALYILDKRSGGKLLPRLEKLAQELEEGSNEERR